MSTSNSGKETGVYQRHTRRCPKTSGGSGYAPHRCAGRWSYVLDVGRDSNGTRIQETKGGFRTRKEAGQARAARRVLLRHRPVDAYNLTVAQWLPMWLEGKRKLKATTRESYSDYVERLFVPRLGRYRMLALEEDPQPVEAFFTWLASEATDRWGNPLSAATQHRVHAVLRASFNVAIRKRLISFNPVADVETPDVPRPVIEVWTVEELVDFLDYLGGDAEQRRKPERLRAFYWQAATTAMRRGELLGQRWDEDVKLDDAATKVSRNRVKTRAGVIEGSPKTRTSDRPVTFDGDTVQVLRQHRSEQQAERAAAGNGWVETGLVYVNPDGTPINPDYVSRRFKTLCHRAGLPVIPLKNLRHTSLTLALDAGVHLKVVSERAGHSSMWFTGDTYAHVVPAVARQAADTIGEVLSLEAARKGRRHAETRPPVAKEVQAVSAM